MFWIWSSIKIISGKVYSISDFIIFFCFVLQSQNIRIKQSQIAEKQKELTTLETERKHQAEKLRQQKQLLAEDEEKMYEVCGSKDYEAVLQETSTKLLQLQVSLIQSMQLVCVCIWFKVSLLVINHHVLLNELFGKRRKELERKVWEWL